MGVRSIDHDYYDWENESDNEDEKYSSAVYTSGCGCCSYAIPVKPENLDQICWNLEKTFELADSVMRHLIDKFGIHWKDMTERAARYAKAKNIREEV